MTGGTGGPAELAEFLRIKKQKEETTLLADPVTDLSILQDRVFGRLLRRVCADGGAPEPFRDELVLRVSAGRIRAPYLRTLLLGDKTPGVMPLAVAAWEAMAATPRKAVTVLTAHNQATDESARLVVRQVPASGDGVAVQAGRRSDGGFAHGAAAFAYNLEAAQDLAFLSLLGHLSGAHPVAQDEPDGDNWSPHGAKPVPEPQAAGPGAFHNELLRLCALETVAPAVLAEISARARAGALTARDLHQVLFRAAGPQWEPVRRYALEAAAAPGKAQAVLKVHAKAAGVRGPRYHERLATDSAGHAKRFAVRVVHGVGEHVHEVTSGAHRSPTVARSVAALRLLANLAGLPAPDLDGTAAAGPQPGTPGGDEGSVATLREMEQAMLLTGLRIEESDTLTGTSPLFTCRISCSAGGEDLDSTGSGASTGSARGKAADAMLRRVLDLPSLQARQPQRTPVRMVAPPERTDGRDPLRVVQVLRDQRTITDLKVDFGVPTGPMFSCTISCRIQDSAYTATARAVGKQAARREAARALLRRLSTVPAPTAAGTPSTPPAPAPVHVPAQRRAPAASTAEAVAAERAVRDVLLDGAALVAQLVDGGVAMALFRVDGASLPGGCPAPLLEADLELVLPHMGVGVRAVTVPIWRAPVRLLTGVLAQLPDQGLHPSVRLWARATRLALTAIAAGLLYPTLDAGERDVWRLGPLPAALAAEAAGLADAMPPHAHCAPAARAPYRLWAPRTVLRQYLDAVAEAVVRGPGAAAVLGTGPWSGPVPRPHQPRLRAWCDQVERSIGHRLPPLVLTIRQPSEGSPLDTDLLWAQLGVRTATTRGGRLHIVPAAEYLPVAGCDPARLERVRSALRAAEPAWPPLGRLLEQERPGRFTVRPAEAALLLGEMGQRLTRAGVEVAWPENWAMGLQLRTVVGSRPVPEATDAPHRFGLANLLDLRWQLALDGDHLTEAEMDALAASARPLQQVRRRWVLLDSPTAHRAGHRDIGTLDVPQALDAALTGAAAVDGVEHPCDPAGPLADLVEALRPGAREPVPAPAALTTALRDYQERGMSWLAHTLNLGFGAVLADDMGLGKTVQTIALRLHRREQAARPYPDLIVAPASMITVWQREIARFAPGTPTHTYHGPERTLDGVTADTVVITTYGTLLRDIDALADFTVDLLIVDEGQFTKNHLSLTARALRRIRSTRRIVLTGTPMENRLLDLWSVADLANPGLFGTVRAFGERFARPIEADPGGEATRRLSRLMSPFLLRRRKSDAHILQELPPKIISHRYIPLTPEQADLYERVAQEAMERIRTAESPLRRALVLTLLSELRKVCNSPAHYLREDPQDPGTYDVPAARRRSGKLAALDELVEQVQEESGGGALVFTNYAVMGRLLVAHLTAQGIAPLFLHGGIPPGPKRQHLVDAFQDGRSPVLISTMKAGGNGLTLTRAADVILYDRPWNPAVEDQATDRAHRLGQDRTVRVHRLATELTVEDRVDALLHHKRTLADAAVPHAAETALGELSNGELADLITLGARP
ncbi:DEAD/DEAH box helicase [Streptomyces kaniharaensis]|uniref:DEAD/DEAH box helicase n=1 Tax=Streptomyces kaniharaensis TaxID=212423 RepID=A0A6N7L0H7_9ACTN|nr:DEAD/DEAH box helicase [Streptomyces kaniharaensis]MQS17352.1 DEAD/DEAH box helicase [Streptomyces kaniharaensis]